MSDVENKELRKCSDCRSTMLLQYFAVNKKGEHYKCCDNCRAKRKVQRASTEYKEKKAISRKARYEKNKEKELKQRKEWHENNKERDLATKKAYRENNKEKCREMSKRWEENNKERRAATAKAYREAHRDEHNKKYNEKRQNDDMLRMTTNLRNRVYKTVKKGHKSASTMELTGCGIEELKEHLASKFTEGMTFENYGEWHIDHILPCTSFNLLLPEEQRKCFHYTNLQPLWAIDNIKKGAKIL